MQPRYRCFLVTAVVIALPLASLVGGGWYWLNQLQKLDNEIAERINTLQGYQRVLRTLPMLSAELEHVSANEELKSLYFDAATPALAGATLQRLVKDLVDGAGGRLLSSQLLPAQPADQVPKVRLRIQLQGTVETLLDVLLEVEQARPMLFVEQVSVRSTARVRQSPVSRGGAQRPSPPRNEGMLTVQLDVFGYDLRERI